MVTWNLALKTAVVQPAASDITWPWNWVLWTLSHYLYCRTWCCCRCLLTAEHDVTVDVCILQNRCCCQVCSLQSMMLMSMSAHCRTWCYCRCLLTAEHDVNVDVCLLQNMMLLWMSAYCRTRCWCGYLLTAEYGVAVDVRLLQNMHVWLLDTYQA
jgi:hypothetical protein